MQRHGFIHDMLDVKVLILFVLSRAEYPMDREKVYELCFQDDCLSYFDVCEALPQLEESGHVTRAEDGTYRITEKGRENGAVTEDAIAYPVMQRALLAVERFNREIRRDGLIRTEVMQRADGEYAAVMSLNDEHGGLMTLELHAPNEQQARRMARTFHADAEQFYQTIMNYMISRMEDKPKRTKEN